MDNPGLQLYLLEVRQHKANYLEELDALRQDLLQGALNVVIIWLPNGFFSFLNSVWECLTVKLCLIAFDIW